MMVVPRCQPSVEMNKIGFNEFCRKLNLFNLKDWFL